MAKKRDTGRKEPKSQRQKVISRRFLLTSGATAGFGVAVLSGTGEARAAEVKQRLKLAACSPRLLDLYAEDEMTLEQLMAFTVTDDHARQEQVWDSLARSYNKEPYYIRRQLTEGAIGATDKRTKFVGLDAYQAAGGTVTRDLFENDNGGWLQAPALLDRLIAEKLNREAEALRGEGWKRIEAVADFPFGHSSGIRRLPGETPPLVEEEQSTCDFVVKMRSPTSGVGYAAPLNGCNSATKLRKLYGAGIPALARRKCAAHSLPASADHKTS